MRLQCDQDTLARLEALADTGTDEELRKALQGLAGMGPFTCTNVMQLLSRFDCIPCDSETQRHLKMYRGLAKTTAANLKQVAAEVCHCWCSCLASDSPGLAPTDPRVWFADILALAALSVLGVLV